MQRHQARLSLKRAPLVVASVVSVRDLGRVARSRTPDWDVVEIRLDLMKPGNDQWLRDVGRLKKRGIPVLLTIRSAYEGGAWKGSEESRMAEYEKYLPRVSAVDVEICSKAFAPVRKAAHAHGVAVIGSFHDFRRTLHATKLMYLIRQARRGGADVVKLATLIRGPQDVATLYRVLMARKFGPLCLIGMGTLGRHTRLGLPSMGSCLAYGHIGARAAPGQLPCRELRHWLTRPA